MKKMLILLLTAAIAISALSCGAAPPDDTAAATTGAAAAETKAETAPPQTQNETEPETTAPAQTEKETVMTSYQIIPDLYFEKGISLLSQKDHQKYDRYSVLAKHDFYGGEAKEPLWLLAQWDSGPDLVSSLIPSPPDTITDGRWRTFSYDAENNVMTFRLDTSAYYQGRPSVEGDYWPHLLIEQGDFEFYRLDKEARPFYRCSTDKLIVSFDIKLGDYEETAIEGDWVRAAQFLMYFYIKGTQNNDFCWFGIQMFDNRIAENEHYIGYDGGKADASGAMIYSIGSKYVYANSEGRLWENGKPKPNGDWVHVEIDIKPYLEDMLRCGLADGYFKTTDLQYMRIGGMNIGWETIGTFDHTMYIRDLKLTSYKENQ